MRNLILSRLSCTDRSLLRPYLSPVTLPVRTILEEPDRPIEWVHFMESGLASVLAQAGQEKVEIGIIGQEGMTGISALMGGASAGHLVIVQIEGAAQRLRADALVEAMAESRSLARTLLLFAHVQFVQAGQTALANGRCTVEQRLARWLLMAHDRLGRDEIGLTHDFLAMMLGVRRPGVTVALHVLEGVRAIRSRRSSITILDRAKLREVAGSAYGVTETLYEQTLGGTLLEA